MIQFPFLQKIPLQKCLHALTVALIVYLPFHVVFAVFGEAKLGTPIFSYLKEFLFFLYALTLAGLYFISGKKLRFDWLDRAIVTYIFFFIIVTVFHWHSLSAFIAGARFDFQFFIAFLLFRHGSQFLSETYTWYVKKFLMSGGVALGLSFCVRWVFGEEILLHIGFSPLLSDWSFGGQPPIFHGIDGAGVRRFQGIFDGPNPAAAFIIIYLAALWSIFSKKKDFLVLMLFPTIMLFGMLLYTYSRSAVLGAIAATGLLFLYSLPYLWKKDRTLLCILLVSILGFSSVLYIKYFSGGTQIVSREGSTKGHMERMQIGIERVGEHPLGQGLATAGPAFRYTAPIQVNKSINDIQNKDLENFYIPESWYVQQAIEGGIIGLLLFLGVMILLFLRCFQRNIWFAAAFLAIAIMNLFLHTFESSSIMLLFFLLLGILIPAKAK